MNAKQQIEKKLQKLTSHQNIEIVTKGNSAIFSALHAVKTLSIPKESRCARGPKVSDKEIIIPEEGGWLTYQQYPQKLNLKTTRVKTNNAVINLKDLEKKSKFAGAILYQNPGGYHAEQPIKEIYQICQKNDCLVILDASGGIGTKLCDGNYADIIVGSFGKWKLVEAKVGGFISCKDKQIFNKIKSSFETLDEEKDLKKINKKINDLQNRIKFLTEKRKKIIDDLKDFNIINKNHLGFVLLVEYNDNKEKLINYCKNNGLEYTECPRYIRVNKKAISIEIKRLSL